MPMRPSGRAASTASSSVGSRRPDPNHTRRMPNWGRMFSIRNSVPPYTGALASRTSPGRSTLNIVVEIAAMPDENTRPDSASSHRPSRSSRISRSGLFTRE